MIKLSTLSGAALAACVLLAGCFTSEQPLFDQRAGEPIMGGGAVSVVAHDDAEEPDGGVLHWQSGAYVDTSDKDHTTVSFHRLPGTWPWDGWFIGETQINNDRGHGYMYELYRKRGTKIFVFNASCSDLTEKEAAQAHLVRTESGQECHATRADDIAQALRLLSARKPAKSYWTFASTKP